MTWGFFFAWYDGWIGYFWDARKRKLYVCPFPWCVFWLQCKQKRCVECGAYFGHAPDCRNRTFKEKAKQHEDYYHHWRVAQEQAQSRWNRVRVQVEQLEGKLLILRRENNALRRKKEGGK